MQESIIIERGANWWLGGAVLFAIVVFLALRGELRGVAWPLGVGVAVLTLVLLARTPARVVFDAGMRLLHFEYPLGGLLQRDESLPFAALQAVRSAPRNAGDGPGEAVLEVLLADGGSRVIQRVALNRDPAAELAGSAPQEPPAMAELRRRIAALTGAADQGYGR